MSSGCGQVTEHALVELTQKLVTPSEMRIHLIACSAECPGKYLWISNLITKPELFLEVEDVI
jgi:hypothetical protein